MPSPPPAPRPGAATVVGPAAAAEAIAEYALLSDFQGSALVSRAGSIDWACLPRFDSPSVFGRLLGPGAGHWQLAPLAEATSQRWYVGDSLVLRTEFTTSEGRVAVTDAMPFEPCEPSLHIGRRSPHGIVRVVEGLEGRVAMFSELAPRPEYGLTTPLFVPYDGGARSLGGPLSLLVCAAEVFSELDGGTLRSRFGVEAGQQIRLSVRLASPWDDDPPGWQPEEVSARLADTIEGWHSWSRQHQTYEGPFREAVRLSGRVLHGLTYKPTGAVVAAATTSLPETPGGSRNWDYRFCWVRDASLTLEALWVAACPEAAGDFFDFLATAGGGRIGQGDDLQILYGVGGERHVFEHELDHLDGFAGAKPVRIGNAAWRQRQTDVYGELLSAAARYAEQIRTLDEATSRFLRGAADEAARRWTEPDQGIWEMRGPPCHFLHSKLLCWVALDRAVHLAERIDARHRVEDWAATAAEIRAAIETEGWNAEVGAFTQSFGSPALDASALMVPLVGFLPHDDPRVVATVDAIARDLTDEYGFVYRYRSDDGLEGEEGTFLLCTFWLAECLARRGDVDEASRLVVTLLSHANDVGLLAEEIDPRSRQLLGNFPQAFTHIGLINAAWAIAQARRAAQPEGCPSP